MSFVDLKVVYNNRNMSFCIQSSKKIRENLILFINIIYKIYILKVVPEVIKRKFIYILKKKLLNKIG